MKWNQTILMLIMALTLVTAVSAATSQSENVTVTINNRAPTIIDVSAIPPQDPTEQSTTAVYLNFTAEDLDRYGNLNDSTAKAVFTKSGEATRQATCTVNSHPNENRTIYDCTVYMYFYDLYGTWTVNVSVNDISNSLAYNDTTTFTYNQLKAFVRSPVTISFGSVYMGTLDNEATTPSTLNNTGNVDITQINVTAHHLSGETIPTESIGAGNFTISLTTGNPTGNNMIEGTPVTITGATLPRGAPPTNQEQLFYYLDMPTGLTSQTFSTASGNEWVIDVT